MAGEQHMADGPKMADDQNDVPPLPAPAPVRVRMAPSPTGYFHVGNARTAVFNWLFAQSHGGKFVWRVEDTDRARYVEAALGDQAESLEWLGLTVDEGPMNGGPYGPYFQSQRLAHYHRHADELLAAGHAYRCFCSSQRLEAVRQERQRMGLKVGYDRHCRNLAPEEVAARMAEGGPHVLRLKMPLAEEIVLADVLRGDIHFAASEFEDVVIVKSDGYPTYHLAVVVDDHMMAITHVLRADEWIPSGPIQVQLYRLFGWPEPVWAHMPMVLNPSGKGKLSKRNTVDAQGQALVRKDGQPELMVQVREYRAAGYLPEAMFNYLALLGWAYSGDEEIFSRRQAIERFKLEDVKSSPAAWNPEKLLWMNGMYIRMLDPEDLTDRLMPFLTQAGLAPDRPLVRLLAPLIQERINTLAEVVPLVDFFWSKMVSPVPADLIPKKLDAAGTADVLAAAGAALSGLPAAAWRHLELEAALRGMADRMGLGAGVAFQPVRVAVTGKRVSPPLFETIEILGAELTLARLAAARDLLAR